MNKGTELDALTANCDAILFAEIGAWLHLIWKYDWRFIEKHCGSGGDWDQKAFLDALTAEGVGKALFAILGRGQDGCRERLSVLLSNVPGSFAEFVLKHAQAGEARDSTSTLDPLTRLLIDAHGRSSGADKPFAIDANQQRLPNVALISAFGVERRRVVNTDYDPAALFRALDAALRESSWKIEKLVVTIRTALFMHLSRVPAETRRPANDITIYDQTALAAAFFKAALARCVVDERFEAFDVNGEPIHKWRSLVVRVDSPNWFAGSRAVADLLARRTMIRMAWDDLAELIEYKYAMGAEVYRDHSQIAFLVTDADVLGWQHQRGATLGDMIRRAVEDRTAGEVSPDVENVLAKDGSRAVFPGERLSRKLPLNTSDVAVMRTAWNETRADGRGRERCSNCGLRPFGEKKAASRQICGQCLDKRDKRSSDWFKSGAQGTVWIDEASDRNGRIALIVGRLDLDGWLNGAAITGVRAVQDVVENRKKNLQWEASFEGLVSLASRDFRAASNLLAFTSHTNLEEYVENNLKDWRVFCRHKYPGPETLFAIASTAQQPSFARLRRVWEDAREFWRTLLPADGSGGALLSAVGRSGYERLRIDLQRTPKAGPWHTMALRHKDVEFEAAWIPEDGGYFLTIDNLEYTRKVHGKDCLPSQGDEIEVSEPGGYMLQGKESERCKVAAVAPQRDFAPVIGLVADDPATFMAIVPAASAVAAVKAIAQEYRRQMGKVCNRLPLHVGAVFANKYTPLRAVLSAGRRMLDFGGGAPQWKVTGEGEITGADGRSIAWPKPASATDQYFEHAYVVDSPGGTRISHKGFLDGAVAGLARLSDLQVGDEILFTPSTFDFEWLENSAGRFRIAYDENGVRRGRTTRPWLLDDVERIEGMWDRLSAKPAGLENRQIHGLAAMIEARREDWAPPPADETFREFCRVAVAEADWGEPLNVTDAMRWGDYGVSGELTDVVELYTKVMKER